MLLLLWGERGRQDDLDVVPGQVIGLGQVLKFFSKGGGVAGKRPEMPLNLCEVRHGKWDVYPDNTLLSCSLPQGRMGLGIEAAVEEGSLRVA